MGITVTTTIPPQIKEFYSKTLLSTPLKAFTDTEEDIINILEFVKVVLWKKLDKCPAKKHKCEKLYKEIIEIYDAIKTEKENRKAKAKNITDRPFYYFKCSRRSSTDILNRCKYRARVFCREQSSSPISKV